MGLVNAVGLNDSRKQRESLLNVKIALVSVDVYSCDLYLVSWLGHINVVSEENDLL